MNEKAGERVSGTRMRAITTTDSHTDRYMGMGTKMKEAGSMGMDTTSLRAHDDGSVSHDAVEVQLSLGISGEERLTD